MDPAQQQMQQYQQQQAMVDSSHLRLLSIFHYVWGGLSILLGIFMVCYIFLMRFIIENAAASGSGGGDLQQMEMMMTMMAVIYGGLGVLCLILAICNLFCGKFLSSRKHRTFIMIISGINCLSIPLGTTLGVFTFIVLLRPSVAATFDSGQQY